MDIQPIITKCLNAFGRNLASFIFPSLLITLFIYLDPKFWLLTPFGVGLIVRSAVVALDLRPDSKYWWFNKSVSNCLNIYLLGFVILIGSILSVLLLTVLYGKNALDGTVGNFVFVCLVIILTSAVLYRGWPLLAAAYLTEGTFFYSNPFHRYIPWYVGPAWIGPGAATAWGWTGHSVVARHISPAVVLALLVSMGLLLSAATVFAHSTLAGLFTVFCVVLLVLSPVLVILTDCCWITMLYNSALLLVLSSEQIPVSDPDLIAKQTDFQERRMVTYRFPDNYGAIQSCIFPPGLMEAHREQLLEELRALGPNCSFHGGNYIELWTRQVTMRAGAFPELIVDCQGDVLLACLPDLSSEMSKKFEDLVVGWSQKYPVFRPGS